jgi:2-keto-3-deoxy-L-rhamnonate aldolase RhmA
MSDKMDQSENPLLQRLAAGEAVLVLPLRISRSPHVVHMARNAGFDAVYVDMEHSTVSLEATAELCLAAASVGVTPLVRVPSHDPYYIGRVLEGGATGIIAPHVNSAAEAAAIVDHCRFPPRGKRAMAGVSVALRYEALPADEGGRRLDARTTVIVMLESAEAVAHSDAIAAVPGVDVLLVGTGDLTEELGIHGQHDHPKVWAAYETVGAACRKHGRHLGVAGIKGASPMLEKLYRQGARFFSAKNDETLLLAGIREETRTLRGIFGG